MLRAALLIARALGLPAPRGAAVRRADVRVGGVTGRGWFPREPAPGVLLVGGVTPQGVRDPRLDRAAAAVARAGRTVFAPDLLLAERRLTEEDVRRVRRAAHALADHPHVAGCTVGVGISFGGSVLLLAAADPAVAARLAAVATFGAYADLVGYLQALVTGVSTVDGRQFGWPAHRERLAEFRRAVVDLLHERAPELLDGAQRAALNRALDGAADPAELQAVARSVHAALAHDDPDRTEELVAALPAPLREAIWRFSPVRAAPQLSVPILALHSSDDVVVPVAELERLAAAYPHARTYRVPSLAHVDLTREPGRLVEGLRALRLLVGFAADVLRAGLPPGAVRGGVRRRARRPGS